MGPFKLGGDTWYLNLLIVIPSIIFLTITIFWIVAIEFTKRRLKKILPEAEVKIQLALFKLEQKHTVKVKKNEERRLRILED